MRQYSAPNTEQDFERFCLEFLRRFWRRPNLDLYAKRGEEQSGIDIIDTTNASDLWAAQCKLHEPWKTLPPAEITAEVEKAKTFRFSLSHYAICTTARKTGPAQERAIEINVAHQIAGLFTVRIIYWEEIEAYLGQDQGLVDILGANTNASVRRVVREENAAFGAQFALLLSQVQPVLEAAATAADVELDRAKRLLERHERRAAETLLVDLKARAADRFTPLQAFRCFSMLAAIAFNRGAYEEAADLFTKAHAAHPEHERAMANLAHAEFLLGRPERAWERAQEAFNTHPRVTHVAAVYVALAPESVTVETIIAALSENILEHPEVIWAIANRYLLADRLDEAIHWARRVAEDGECALNALVVLGQALLKAGLHSDRTASDSAVHLREAATVFERAAIRAEAEGERHVAIYAKLHQLDATDANADANAFEAIIEQGLRIADETPEARGRFLLARAGMYQQQGDVARAARDAEKAVALYRSVDTRAMYATCLWNRNTGADRIMARREMARLLDEAPTELIEQCTDFMVRTCLFHKLWAEAESAVKVAEGRGLDAAAAFAYRADVARAENRLDDAQQTAREAVSRLHGASSRMTQMRVVNALVSVGLEADALPILEPLASHTELTHETRSLIHCALRSERHDLLLQYCEDLRKAGVHDLRLLQIELGYLEKYAPRKAVEVIEALLLNTPDERTLRVRRAVLGTRLKRADLAVFTPGDAPPPNEVEIEFVQATVECLVRNGFHAEAVEYAYRCLHRFPDQPTAHIALIRSTLLVPHEAVEAVLAVPTEVSVGSVVEYQEQGELQIVHAVIEDELPRAFPDMIDAASPIAKAFLGHREGNEVVLARGASRDRTAMIRRVDNKYRHRMNECMNSWQLRFPETPFLEQVRMASDPETGQLDLAPIIKSLKAVKERTKQLAEHYRTGFVSVPFMAEQLGRSVFETMQYLGTEDDLFINCGFVTPEVHAAATERLRRAPGLVLDVTALWTLQALDLVSVLERFPIPVAIVQPTLDAVRRMLKEQVSGEGGKRAVLTLLGEKIGYAEMAPEAERAERERWEVIADTLERRCTVLDATPLAGLEPRRREDLEKFVGDDGAQAIAAAKNATYHLWTDDRVHEFVAKEFLAVERVWTQAVLGWLCEREILTPAEFARASARLQALHYSGTYVNPEILVEAGRLANWQATSIILQRNLRILGDPKTLPVNRLNMALEFILAANREAVLDLSRDAVIMATLERLRDRPVGVRIVHELLRRVRSAMPLDPFRAARVSATLQAWLRAEQGRFMT